MCVCVCVCVCGVCEGAKLTLSSHTNPQMFTMMREDLSNAAVLSLSDAEVRLLRIASQQLSYKGIKLAGKLKGETALSLLQDCNTLVDDALQLLAAKVGMHLK